MTPEEHKALVDRMNRLERLLFLTIEGLREVLVRSPRLDMLDRQALKDFLEELRARGI